MKKVLILIAVFLVAAASGGAFGCNMGNMFVRVWAEQKVDRITADSAYQSIIKENINRLEQHNMVPAYEDMVGYSLDGVIEEQEQQWNLVLVNKWNSMDAGYEPDLEVISEGHRVDARITDYLRDMIRDAKNDGYYIYILSSYRDMDKQISLYEDEVKKWEQQGYDKEAAAEKAGTIVAFPGTSEHHLGLAVDLVSSEHIKLDQDAEKTKGYQWLVKNCHKYGFILRYPNNASDITGIIYEPWHFRYVGEEAATVIMEQGITLEEYLSDIASEK